MPNSAVLSDARLITLCEIVVVALLAVQLALLGWRLVQPQGPVGQPVLAYPVASAALSERFDPFAGAVPVSPGVSAAEAESAFVAASPAEAADEAEAASGAAAAQRKDGIRRTAPSRTGRRTRRGMIGSPECSRDGTDSNAAPAATPRMPFSTVTISANVTERRKP